MEKDTFLVIGADGLIGRGLIDYLKSCGESVLGTTRRPDTVSCSRLYLDLAADVAQWRPPCPISVAYLCGAVSTLRACLEKPVQSTVVNVQHTVALAKTLIENKAFVVFPSSNLVFDGSAPFQKADAPTCPETEYGRQKVEAEKGLLSFENSVAVVRLTKVLSSEMSLFADWTRKLCNNETITPFSDMLISPVPLHFVVNILYCVGKRRRAGIVQVSGEKDITYGEMARRIAWNMGADPALVRPIKLCESGLNLEAAPLHTTLDTSRLHNEFGIVLPGVWAAIDSVWNLS